MITLMFKKNSTCIPMSRFSSSIKFSEERNLSDLGIINKKNVFVLYIKQNSCFLYVYFTYST
ncbi:hypothetical protein SDC9_103737 [bioreactor metagenome]|uniref:Uncharacterized protein n=1 Tax=bioreactor metagenome TaxID=1076179 RepID=A0A645AUW2_9ZZZZ